MSALPLVTANLVTVCVEDFLYGVFFVLCSTSAYILSSYNLTRALGGGRNGSMLKKPIIFAAVALFITVTAHFVVTNIRLFQAFVIYEGGSAPLDFYSDMGQTTEVVQVGLFVTSLAIADAMMIYRTWVIWNYNRWIVMPPTCIFVGLIVSGIGITYQFSRYTPTESIFIFQAGRWISSECVFTLCINIYCTVMIVWRIMKINAASKRFGGANLTPALAIFVESAGLYTSWAVIYFACYESQTNFHATAQDIWCIISGISFLLIIVRVGMGWAHGPHASGTREILYNPRDRMPVSLCRTTPLAITVTRVTEQDHESAEERKFMAESPRMLDSMQVA